MATYHCSVKIISRSSGRSSVGASAYRSGEKLYNERDGQTHDYTKKSGVVFNTIITPDHAPDWTKNREQLWNQVEQIEKSKNSQLAREVEVSLPVELKRDQQIELIKEYAKENFTDQGMVADISIHDKLDGNPHAHIMLTMRPFEEDGSWGSKSKKQYLLDQEGKKIYTEKGNPKSIKIDTTDWNKKETLEKWRENWANTCNKHLEKSQIPTRIDHRSYSDQGIDKLPTVHLGHVANAMEKRGIPTERGEKNRLINNINRRIEDILDQIKNLFRQRIEIIRSVEPTTAAEKKSYLTRQYQKHLPAVKHLHADSIEFLYKLNKDRGKPNSMQELKEIYTKKGKLLETDPSPENFKDFEGIRDFMDDLKRAHLTERSDQAEFKAKTNVLSRAFEIGD